VEEVKAWPVVGVSGSSRVSWAYTYFTADLSEWPACERSASGALLSGIT
jgi:hypothetical protein